MFRSLIRLALAFATFALVIPDTFAHDSWISRGGHRNAAGEWCCGDGDCFVIPKERIMMTGEGYVIIQGPLAGVGPQQYESVPFSEAQPSPDGEFWRCKRPDGTRRCFFAPPPATCGSDRSKASSPPQTRRSGRIGRRPGATGRADAPMNWRLLPEHVTYRRCRH